MLSIITNEVFQGFPATLAPEKKLLGKKYEYQIDRFLGHRGRGRLYQALDLPERQPCVIKEYVLPKKYFDEKEAKERLGYFRQRAKIELAEGKKQDFRLILPTDVILPDTEKDELQQERCYLVTPGELDTSTTLTQYLIEKGAMTDKQVGQLLNQVLQTLEFLHTQKFSLPSGLEQDGLAHGNLSLDSLLIAPQERGFFIYLCDLNLWEGLFVAPSKMELSQTKTDLSSVPRLNEKLIKADLQHLGLVAFDLLTGVIHYYASDQQLDPKVTEQWSTIKSTQLKDFISQLIKGSFKSANKARQKLIDLLPQAEQDIKIPQTPQPVKRVKEEDNQKSKLFYFLPLGGVFGLLLGLVIGLAIGFVITKNRQKRAISSEFLPCCIKQVPDIPSGEFTYTAEQNSTWDYILKQKNLIAYDKNLEEEIKQRKQPKLKKITYSPKPSITKAIAQVSLAEADFAIASLFSLENFEQRFLYTKLGEREVIPSDLKNLKNSLDTNLSNELRSEKFAYDGLVVFVPFTYAQTKNSLTKALKGKISLENLRKLYTDVDNKYEKWKHLDANLPDISIRLYIPCSEEAVRIFEQRVLKDKRSISAFRKLKPKSRNEQTINQKSFIDSCPNTDTSSKKITRLPTLRMLRQVLNDLYDRQVGSIGFDTFSKVFGQCSVYPLALSENNSEAVSPLIQDNKPITPQTDLCNDKGNYRPNMEAFISQSYPLAYPLVVIYPKDNRRQAPGKKFAYLLRTVEAQRLLKEAGLVPLKAKSLTD